MKEKHWSRYVKLGLCIFLSGAALLVLYLALEHLSALKTLIKSLYTIISPFVYGLAIAYLLCPIYNATCRLVMRWFGGKMKPERAKRWCKSAATVVSLLFLFAVVGSILYLILAQTTRSIISLVQSIPDKATDLIEWVERIFQDHSDSEWIGTLESLVEQYSNTLYTWFNENLLPELGSYVTKTFTGAWVTLKTLLNIFVGIFVCVYFLNSKDIFKAQAKKSILALFPKDRAEHIFDFFSFTDTQFGGFIQGKLIDSLIIGILCAILMSLLKLPYVPLISIIVGITNIIPFFGPFIGAIPSILILLLESPVQALTFGIMILLLQQFDGNFLGPKILGKTSGLANFWVLFAILVFGGLFGFVGMIVAVPFFAVIYYYCKKYIQKKLAEKQLSANTDDYLDPEPYAPKRPKRPKQDKARSKQETQGDPS